MGRELEVVRIQLDGLAGKDLELLINDLVGSAAPNLLVQAVTAATDGNPFFVEEMTLHLVDSGAVTNFSGAGVGPEGKLAGVPERVRETVGRRLLSLSGDTVELLSIGSVIGREFDLSVVGASSGLNNTRLVDAADDAVLSGMVVETGPGRLSFSHALVRDAVSTRMTYARQASIHRRVSEAIEHRWPANPTLAAELARHWSAVAAVDPTATATAAAWAVRAGDVALAAAAADEAIARYEQASCVVGEGVRASFCGCAGPVWGRLCNMGAAPDEADDALSRRHAAGGGTPGVPAAEARAAIGLGRRYPYWETERRSHRRTGGGPGGRGRRRSRRCGGLSDGVARDAFDHGIRARPGPAAGRPGP